MWEVAKNLWANWGTTSFWFSSLVAAVIGVLAWWVVGAIAYFSTPRATVQAEPRSVPSIQQSVGNVSGGTVNQAGGNITIINQGVSEDAIRQLINQKVMSEHARLAGEYPMGYVILGVADGKIVYFSDNAPKDLQIKWNLANIKLDRVAGIVDVQFPDFVDGKGNGISGCSARLPYRTGNKTGIFAVAGYRTSFEVLDADAGIFVVGIK